MFVIEMSPNPTNFKLATLNVQSLNTGGDEQIRTVSASEPDTFTVTETRINESSNLEHYRYISVIVCYKNIAAQAAGAQIGIYIQNRLRIQGIVLPPGDLRE